MVHKRLRIFLIIISAAFLLSGCAIRRKMDSGDAFNGQESEITANIYRLDYSPTDYKTLCPLFLGMTEEEAEPYYTSSYGIYEVNGLTFKMGGSVYFRNEQEGAASCYEWVILNSWSELYKARTLRSYYPEENLDSCSKEEAIEFCRPYAEACGYGQADVSVYAVPLSQLKSYGSSAPDPTFEPVTKRQIEEAREAGDTEEANRLSELYNSPYTRGVPWEKKDEAFFLVYQTQLDGLLMESAYQYLLIIYAPQYDIPVYIEGTQALQLTEQIETQTLVSKGEAFGEALLVKGISDVKEVEIDQVSLIYEMDLNTEEKDGRLETWFKTVPCWKVEYRTNGTRTTVIIDAVKGCEHIEW